MTRRSTAFGRHATRLIGWNATFPPPALSSLPQNAITIARSISSNRNGTSSARNTPSPMHLRQLPSGRWRVIVKAGGRQRTGTADRRTDAQRLGAQLLLALGGTPTRGRATVGDIIANLDASRAGRWSATYRADVRSVTDKLPTSFLD